MRSTIALPKRRAERKKSEKSSGSLDMESILAEAGLCDAYSGFGCLGGNAVGIGFFLAEFFFSVTD